MFKLFPAFLRKKRDACPDIPQRGDRQGFLPRHSGTQPPHVAGPL